jgi:hypothetical protein
MAFQLPSHPNDVQQKMLAFWPKMFYQHIYILYSSLSPHSSLYKTSCKLLERFSEFINHRRMKDLPKLVASLQKLQRQARDQQEYALKHGKSEGLFLPALPQHMIEETEYFLSFFSGCPLTPEQEYKFWMQEASSHVQLLSQMINPGESSNSLISKGIEASKQLQDQKINLFEENKDQKSVFEGLDNVDQVTRTIYQNIKEGKILGFLNSLIVQHELEETAFGKARLKQIGFV